MEQYRWLLHNGYGIAWKECEHPEWAHKDAADAHGLPIEHCAKGILEVRENTALCLVQTPGLLTMMDIEQLQNISDKPLSVVYAHPVARATEKHVKVAP